MIDPSVQSFGVLRSLLGILFDVAKPALYTKSWAPWLRLILTPCILAVIVLVVYVVTAWVGSW